MHVLLALLAILLAVVAVAGLCVLIAVLLSIRSLRRRNRVSPDSPTDAPLTWLVSPATPARLHRRLRSAVSVSRMIAARHAGRPLPDPVLDMAAVLDRQAVALDRHLTVVARLPGRERQKFLPDLAEQANEIERLVSRLSVLDAQAATATAPGLPTQRTAMQDLAEQLDHLEAARQEIDQVERSVGLGPAPTMPAPAPSPSPTDAGRPAAG